MTKCQRCGLRSGAKVLAIDKDAPIKRRMWAVLCKPCRIELPDAPSGALIWPEGFNE